MRPTRSARPGPGFAPALLLAMLSGCGSPETPKAEAVVTKGPHGGTLSKLPGDKGFAEVMVEGGGTSRSQTRFAAYFFKPDRTSTLDPSPTDVVYTPQGGGKSMKLGADPKGGRFVSEPVASTSSGMIGDLTAKLGGEPISVSVLVTPKP